MDIEMAQQKKGTGDHEGRQACTPEAEPARQLLQAEGQAAALRTVSL